MVTDRPQAPNHATAKVLHLRYGTVLIDPDRPEGLVTLLLASTAEGQTHQLYAFQSDRQALLELARRIQNQLKS